MIPTGRSAQREPRLVTGRSNIDGPYRAYGAYSADGAEGALLGGPPLPRIETACTDNFPTNSAEGESGRRGGDVDLQHL